MGPSLCRNEDVNDQELPSSWDGFRFDFHVGSFIFLIVYFVNHKKSGHRPRLVPNFLNHKF